MAKEMFQAFLFDLVTLEEFYNRCIAAKAETEAEKNKILLDLLAEKKITHLGGTDKTGPELAIELIKKGVNAKAIGFKVKKSLDKL